MATYPVPVSSGILCEDHYQRIGPAIWTFIWLIDKTTMEASINGETWGLVLGGRPIKAVEISQTIGFPEITAKRHIRRLRSQGYILTQRTPRGLVVVVAKSKKRKIKNDTSQESDGSKMIPRWIKNDTSIEVSKMILAIKTLHYNTTDRAGGIKNDTSQQKNKSLPSWGWNKSEMVVCPNCNFQVTPIGSDVPFCPECREEIILKAVEG